MISRMISFPIYYINLSISTFKSTSNVIQSSVCEGLILLTRSQQKLYLNY